ncbi:MAG: amidase [Saprospiraceae bacterium]
MYKFLFISIILIYSCSQPQNSMMTTIELEELTIDEIQKAYESGTYNATQLIQAYLNRIEDLDVNGPALNSIIMINPDALTIAAELDKERADGKVRGPMHGIPVILKDNIDTHDKMPCTAGARPMANAMPLQDAHIVKQLRAAGAIILAKANLSEWANFHSSYSSSGWSAIGGQTKNPYVLSRNPCGSSAGSGVSTSANFTMIAIGTETNGSIVCPANNNGIVGIKPTVGLLSRSGIVPISFTQDTPGPMARTVKDAAICLAAMTGVDPNDSKTTPSSPYSNIDYTQYLKLDGLKGKKIGYYKLNVDDFWRIEKNMDKVIADIKAQGAEVIEIDDLFDGNINRPSFQVLLYEFKDGLNKYFASLGPNSPVKDMDDIIKQTFADSIEMQYFDHKLLVDANAKGDLNDKEYLDAIKEMHRLSREEGLDKVMDEHNLDAIISPTRGPAWKTDLTNGDNFRSVSSSSPAAISGYPSVTVPAGNIDGLPHNVSFYGRAWSEPLLLEIAYAFEQATKHRIVPQFLDE